MSIQIFKNLITHLRINSVSETKFNNKRRVFYEIKKGLVSEMECTTAFNDIKLYKKYMGSYR